MADDRNTKLVELVKALEKTGAPHVTEVFRRHKVRVVDGVVELDFPKSYVPPGPPVAPEPPAAKPKAPEPVAPKPKAPEPSPFHTPTRGGR